MRTSCVARRTAVRRPVAVANARPSSAGSAAPAATGETTVCEDGTDDVKAFRGFSPPPTRITATATALNRSLSAQGWSGNGLAGGTDFTYQRTENRLHYWAEVSFEPGLTYGTVTLVVNAGRAAE